MKQLLLVFSFLLLCSVSAFSQFFTFPRYPKGSLYLQTQPFSSGALGGWIAPEFSDGFNRFKKTVWLGSEYFLFDDVSIGLNLGYVYGQVPDSEFENLGILQTPPFLSDEFNFRSNLSARVYFGGWYVGFSSGFQRINYGAEREVVLSWQERSTSSGELLIGLLSLFEAPLYLFLDETNNPNYTAGFEPDETEVVFQQITQRRLTFHFDMGYSLKLKRFQFDAGSTFGYAQFYNKLVEGQRSALIPEDRYVPNRPNLLDRYEKAYVTVYFKLGYLLMEN